MECIICSRAAKYTVLNSKIDEVTLFYILTITPVVSSITVICCICCCMKKKKTRRVITLEVEEVEDPVPITND